MKKKHLFTTTMLIGTVLLTSCQVPTDDASSTPQESTTESTTLESTTQENEVQESTTQGLTEIESFYRTENIEELIENVKFNEDGIYISWWNRDRDCYSWGEEYIVIITKEHYDAEEISVKLPIENNHEIKIYELTKDYLHHTEYTNDGYMYADFPQTYVENYLYKTYRGIDWKEMLNWYEPVAGLVDDYVNRTEAQKNYYKYDSMYTNEFYELTTESFAAAPTFYCYNVEISLRGNEIDESFQTAEIQIGDKTYVQDIGEIRIHSQYPDVGETEYFKKPTIFDQHTMSLSAGRYKTYPGGDGTFQLRQSLIGKALTDMTIEKMYFYDDTSMELLAANVKLSSQEQKDRYPLTMVENIEMDLYWDCKTPLSIPEGNYIEIDLFIKDEDMAKWEYGYSGLIIIEYSDKDGELYHAYLDLELVRHEHNANVWTTYAMLVNEEMRENLVCYFDYYRARFEEWRKVKMW